MSTKHEPAPWTQERDVRASDLPKMLGPDRWAVEIQSGGFTVGYFLPVEWDGRCPQSALVTASPELLEALDDLLAATLDAELNAGIELSDESESLRQKCLAAIAKATAE